MLAISTVANDSSVDLNNIDEFKILRYGDEDDNGDIDKKYTLATSIASNLERFLISGATVEASKEKGVMTGISYADYYYLEALVRLKRLKEKQSVLANL